MTSVLMSIKPKYCELIASGQKTIEVRKSKPKCHVPFKCYIYCTKGKPLWLTQNSNALCDEAYNRLIDDLPILLNGKVIGEFVCDAIIPISVYASDINNHVLLREQPYTCLTDKQMIDYLGNGVEGKGWHISDLKIYGKPKELSEFFHDCGEKPNCEGCEFYYYESNENGTYEECCSPLECFKPLNRPPQSWMYVEANE